MEQNRTVLITGGTSGIGEETALQLARLGWSVWIHGRNSEKVQTVVEKIKAATGNQQIFGITANLSDPKQLPNFVEQIQNQIPTLNVLINNAGLINDGFHNINEFEETWFVNHLVPCYLAIQLKDHLIKNSRDHQPSRIVFVSSAIHQSARIHFDDLNLKNNFAAWTAYGQSKLAVILFAYSFARTIDPQKLGIICVHPGTVSTNFGKTGTPLTQFLLKLIDPLLSSPTKGAASSIMAAADASLVGQTGLYISKGKIRKSSNQTYDQDLQNRIWDLTLHQLKQLPNSQA